MDKTGFEELFEETITSSLRDLLGESSMRAILYHLSLERFAKDPKMFDQKLREVLKAPAIIIEEVIIKDLFRRLDLMYAPTGTFDFQKYANSARDVYKVQEKRRHG
ncbi:MAG TPA: hypothetical protein VLX56_07480 [Nitrososphaerales archaeon]|nr:hypothetical protein [Nitrososphaerales archaeon]